MNGSRSKAASGLAKGVPPNGAARGALDGGRYQGDPKQLVGGRPSSPGLEPGIQAAPLVIIRRQSALDARVKPVHDEPGRATLISGRLFRSTKSSTTEMGSAFATIAGAPVPRPPFENP